MNADIVLALLAGVFFAIYQLFNRLAGLKISLTRMMVTLLTTCVATIALLVFFLVGPPAAWSLSGLGLIYFAAAGFFHFVLGFTFISLSQKRVGAGRTGALVGTVPIFAAIVGWIVLGELISGVRILAIGVIVAGATLISTEQIKGQVAKGTPLYGIGAAASFSISAAFIRSGLVAGAPPLVGLLIGFLTALLFYLLVSLGQRLRSPVLPDSPAPATAPTMGRVYVLQIAAGVAIALAMWFRYIATATVPIAVVTALGRVNIPTILILSPLVLKTPIDTTSLRLWGGATAVLLGTGMLAFL